MTTVRQTTNPLGVARFALGVIMASVPSMVLLQLRVLQLDSLHVGLAQLFSLLVYSLFSWRSAPQAVAEAPPETKTVPKRRRTPKKKHIVEFSPAQIVGLVRPPLSIVYPELAELIAYNDVENPGASADAADVAEKLTPGYSPAPSPLSLKEWPVIHERPEISVSAHPSMRGVYAARAHFADVPPWKVWTAVSSLENTKWDEMVDDATLIGKFQCRGNLAGSFARLALKPVAIIKAKDMVAASASGTFKASETQPFTVVTMARSYAHPDVPPSPSHARTPIKLQATIIQDDGEGGSIYIALVDMSLAAGPWVPAKALSALASVNMPKSVLALGAHARSIPDSAYTEDWAPEALDEPVKTSEAANAEDGAAGDVSDSEASDDASEDISTDIHAIMDQLRTMSARLKTTPPRRSRWVPFLSAGIAAAIAAAATSLAYRRRLLR